MILNEEQRLLKDSVGDFLAQQAPVEAFRQLRDANTDVYSTELWQQLVEMGIPLTALPEADGGVGFGWLGMGAVMEACGRHLSASPLLATCVAGASIIEQCGASEQRSALLSQISSGELTLALAIDELNHFAPSHCECSLQADGDAYRLNGAKTFVIDGSSADKLIVVARSAGEPNSRDGLSLVLIDREQAGLEVTPLDLMDARDAASLRFDNIAIDSAQILGELGSGWPLLEVALDRAAACLAAEMLGGCQELFDRTVEYLKEREQFGAKIGSFQALQHRAAKMYCQLENCRSAVLNALGSLDNQAPDSAVQVSLAKALANDCYRHISNEAVQLHGGMGVTDELDIGLFLKRARVSMQMFGDAGFHRDRYATLHGF